MIKNMLWTQLLKRSSRPPIVAILAALTWYSRVSGILETALGSHQLKQDRFWHFNSQANLNAKTS